MEFLKINMHFIVKCASILKWRPYYINIECIPFKTTHLLKGWLTKLSHSSRTERKLPKGHLPYFLRTSMFQCKVPGMQMEQWKGCPASTVVLLSLICKKLGCRFVRSISNLTWLGSMQPFCLRASTVFTAIKKNQNIQVLPGAIEGMSPRNL